MSSIPLPQSKSQDVIGRRFDALHLVSRILQSSIGDVPVPTAQEVLWVLEEYLGFENGAVLLIEPATGALLLFAVSEQNQGRGLAEPDGDFGKTFKPGLGRGITGWVAQTGTSIRTGDVTMEPHYLAVRENIRSELCVPIRFGDAVIGVVNVESTRAEAYDADDQRLLEIVATQIGLAIQLDGVRREAKLVTTRIDEMVAQRTREISSRNDSLQKMVTIDSLTEIGNRRGFDSVLALELRRARRSSTPISLLMLDIDDFKAYNDSLGHVAGDACLRRLAKTLAATVSRSGDYLARYGGEEFAVILPNTDAKDAQQVAERLQHRVAMEKIAHAHSRVASNLTLSIGTATVKPHSVDVTEADIVEWADKALYRAKAEGRNRVVQMAL